MSTILLSHFMKSSKLSTVALLSIEALAPLSMVAKMPGKYYGSQSAPTKHMLYGLLENALNLHLDQAERGALIKRLQKQCGGAESSGVGYTSILQWHVVFKVEMLPHTLHYQDLWAQHLRGARFALGSRNYDYRAASLIDAAKSGEVVLNDRASAGKEPELIDNFAGRKEVHLNVVRPYFPQYYVSPTPREYVIPQGPYQYRVETTSEIAEAIAAAIADPAAPLYLGSNDGWVEASWEVLP